MKPKNLKLIARTVEDLRVVSAHLQDAIVNINDIANLKKNKISTILTREPGGTKSAELIRNLILKDYFEKNSKEKFDKYTDTLLYLAARNEHIKNKRA